MTEQTRREVIKALARGYSKEKTADLMNVNVEEVESVTQEEIDKGKKNYEDWRAK